MEKERLEKVVNKHRYEKAALLAILHEVQEEDRGLDVDSLRHISRLMDVSFAHVYGLATFYAAFSTVKKGETEIRVCDGLACHLNGAAEIIESLKNELDIEMDETSWDEKYSLHRVQCLGLCTIGPNASFDGKAYSELSREKLLEILEGMKGK
jgi:NADH:ubiquinone oxidoreductase subunit E